MPKMSEQVRVLVGLENLLLKSRRRYRECEREEGRSDGPKGARYKTLIARISEEIHGADKAKLEEYLEYMEQVLLPRISNRVEASKDEMVEAAKQIVDGRTRLHELRTEYTDALERIRSVRERLALDPFKPVEAHFGLGAHPPNVDRRDRDAHDLVREYLKT